MYSASRGKPPSVLFNRGTGRPRHFRHADLPAAVFHSASLGADVKVSDLEKDKNYPPDLDELRRLPSREIQDDLVSITLTT